MRAPGALVRAIRRRWAPTVDPRGIAAVLLYHRVAEVADDPWRLAVSPANFAEHLTIIRKDFHPLPLQELADRLAHGSLAARAVAVTFDDGYRDNLYAAKPLLEQHGVPATVFVVSGYIGSPRDFWWDELVQLRTRSELAELRDLRAAWARLRTLSDEQRRDTLDELWQLTGLTRQRADLVPTEEELATLAAGELVEIGAHTSTHPPLTNLDRRAQRDEIRSGKQRLEALLGRSVGSFSYPHGEYGRRTVACVREAGFRLACVGGQRAVTPRSPLFELPRIHVENVAGDALANQLAELLPA